MKQSKLVDKNLVQQQRLIAHRESGSWTFKKLSTSRTIDVDVMDNSPREMFLFCWRQV